MNHCHYFERKQCVSCTYLNQPYWQQLEARAQDAKAKLPDSDITWFDPVASRPFGFRNKAKIIVGGTSARPSLGVWQGSHVQDLRLCPLYEKPIQEAHGPLDTMISELELTPYSIPERTGDLKSFIVTTSPTGALMVRCVLANDSRLADIAEYFPILATKIDLAVGTVNLHPRHVALPEGETEIHLYGNQTLDMSLGPLPLRLRPQGFFQTNTEIATVLYASAGAWCDEVDPASVWDLYCGVGGFAWSVARPGRSVTGVELSEQAVKAAGGGPGINFIAADVANWVRDHDIPDLVVVNPPRRGLGELAPWLAEHQPRTLLYSSCQLTSAARDLAQVGMRVRQAQVFDMFPHTDHYETLILAERP